MHFSAAEIEKAKALKTAELPWQPAVGDYVWDEFGMVEKPSPFQAQVYFILNHDYFMQLVGGARRFTERMTWLPTWEQARQSLRDLDVSDEHVASSLADAAVMRCGCERLHLYDMLLARLRRTSAVDA